MIRHPVDIGDYVCHPNRPRLFQRALGDVRTVALLFRSYPRFGIVRQFAFHFERMAHFAAQALSDTGKNIGRAVVIDNDVAPIGTVDTAENGGEVLRVFRSGLSEDVAEKNEYA
jgi:hypothetical protein